LTREDGAYKRAERKKEEVLKSHEAFLRPLHLWDDKHAKLPYLYWVPKLHKNPIGQRFIAGCASCSLTNLSRLLSDILNFILSELRTKDDQHILTTGIRRFFVVKSYEELTMFLSKWSSVSFSCLTTGDFSTMYTTIPHEDLERVLKEVIDEAWNWGADQEEIKDVNKLCVEWKLGEVKWYSKNRGNTGDSHSKGKHRLTSKSLLNCISFLIKNLSQIAKSYIFKRLVYLWEPTVGLA
jgi:hypothetical protein